MMIDSGSIEDALRAADNPRFIASYEELAAVAAGWKGCELLGIDTEFLRERTYRADLGLVQISDGKTAWLIDTVQIRNLDPLRALFTHPNIMKVFHSASEDLEVLWHTLNVTPAPMADTQIACAMLGQALQTSYHNAVKWMTAVEVDKEQTRSNWLRRPLTAKQLHYAATDVVFLPAMHRQLHTELLRHGRWAWLLEDVTRMATGSKVAVEFGQAYLRISGCHKLDNASLRVLRALAAWREAIALEQNSARGFILPDAILLQLATRKPKTKEELQGIQDLHPRALKDHQDSLLKIIEESKDSLSPLEQELPLDPVQRRKMDVMRDAVQAKALSLNIDPALLASKKQLETFLRAKEAGQPLPERLSGWRQTLITETLLKSL